MVDTYKNSSRQDKLFVINLLMAIFAAVALISFDASDPSFYHYSSEVSINNWEGLLGAHLSAALIYLLGYGAYLIPIMLFICCVPGFVS